MPSEICIEYPFTTNTDLLQNNISLMATAAYISTGNECIDKLRSSRSQDLELTHVALHDDGCEMLFGWLITGDDSSLNGEFPYTFSTVAMNDTRMGDRGFSALIDWLESIKQPTVTFLNLRSNIIRGTSSLAERFLDAISTSLTTLHLSNNALSSDFRASLLSNLHQLSSLRILGISMCGLMHSDASLLAEYLASPKCTLIAFSANANYLGYNGVQRIVDSLRRNYCIQKVEMFSNELTEEEVHEGDSGVAVDADALGLREWVGVGGTLAHYARGSGCGADMAKLTTALETIIGRNVVLRHAVAWDAFLLLKWGRALLMRGSKARDDAKPLPNGFTTLPIELKLYILSFLAPVLSEAQCARVLQYAADLRRLPALRLSLPVSRSSVVPPRLGTHSPVRETPGFAGKGRRHGSLAVSSLVPETVPPATEVPIIGICRLPHLGVQCTCHNTRQVLWLESMCCDAYDVGS